MTRSVTQQKRMTNTEGRGRTAPARTRHAPRSVRLLKILTAILAVLLLWGILSWLISSIPLKKIRVEGLTRYTEEEILATAGLSECRHLTDVDRDAVRASLTAFYPYIRSVRVRYAFPFGIRLTVEEETPQYYTCIAGEHFALSGELKILERATSERRFREAGLRKITLTGIQSAMLGQVLTYDGNYLTQVLHDIDQSDMGGRITDVQLGDRYHLSVICDGLHTLYLGEIGSIDVKLHIASLMLEDMQLPEGHTAVLDVSDVKKTSIRYQSLPNDVLGLSE